MLDDGELGLLVPAGDEAAMAEAIRAVRADQASAAARADRARAKALDDSRLRRWRRTMAEFSGFQCNEIGPSTADLRAARHFGLRCRGDRDHDP